VTVVRGRLLPAGAAPARGERAEVVARLGPVTVEQVLTGVLEAPVDFDQDHDEWAAVLSGAAVLDVAGERVALTAGEWVLLPAHVRHRLVEARPGTTWLTVHAPA
jgi:cupin 2 domain-containing protein